MSADLGAIHKPKYIRARVWDDVHNKSWSDIDELLDEDALDDVTSFIWTNIAALRREIWLQARFGPLKVSPE